MFSKNKFKLGQLVKLSVLAGTSVLTKKKTFVINVAVQQYGKTITIIPKKITLLPVKFITPAGDPVKSPQDSGDGQNEFTFNAAKQGVLTINLKARLLDAYKLPATLKHKLCFRVDVIGNSKILWHATNAGGKPTIQGDLLTAQVKFIGLPLKNTDFGKKTVYLQLAGKPLSKAIYEVFYTGNASNHQDKANPTYPNWFVYYKQNAGGGTYGYDGSAKTSYSFAGRGESSIRIANNAYTGGDTLITGINAQGRLELIGRTAFRKRYKYFYGVVAHEKQHAINKSPKVEDEDGDDLSSDFERNISKTNPNDKFSADPNNKISDDQVYAGGPVEENAIK